MPKTLYIDRWCTYITMNARKCNLHGRIHQIKHRAGYFWDETASAFKLSLLNKFKQ